MTNIMFSDECLDIFADGGYEEGPAQLIIAALASELLELRRIRRAQADIQIQIMKEQASRIGR